MVNRDLHAEVLIVGAGLSGLLAADTLEKHGKKVIVLDEGSIVGGRMETLRIGPCVADTGAQFFTIRNEKFQTLVDQWIVDQLVFRWSMGWSDGSLAQPVDDGYSRYAVFGGMTALMQHLAQNLKDVRTGIRVTRVAPQGQSHWTVSDAAGRQYTAEALVLTPPAPQSLALVKAGSTRLNPGDQEALEKIEYQPCLTGLFLLNDQVQLPSPGAVQRPNAPISWIANNRQKGISDAATIITVQADGAYSQQLWEEDDSRILNALRTDLMVWLPQNHKIIEEQLKRWRYSAPTVLHPERILIGKDVPKLVFAGDGFGEPGVEGAALSGLAAADALL